MEQKTSKLALSFSSTRAIMVDCAIESSPFCISIKNCSFRQYNAKNRTDIKIGAAVKIVLKADQRTKKLTEGVVSRILTKSSSHPHGIKVMLEDGQVGRVQEILN